MPQSICVDCKNELVSSITFRQKIISSEIYLKRLFDNDNLESVIEVEDPAITELPGNEIIEEFVIEASALRTVDMIKSEEEIIIKSEESYMQCEICSASLANDPLVYHSHMNEHKKEVFPCRICEPNNILFEELKDFKQHVQNYHTNFVFCDTCNTPVKNEENILKNHRREHRQFPFLCRDCSPPKNFSSEQTLNKHILNTHV